MKVKLIIYVLDGLKIYLKTRDADAKDSKKYNKLPVFLIILINNKTLTKMILNKVVRMYQKKNLTNRSLELNMRRLLILQEIQREKV